jgi:hypothetical protein
MLGLGSIFGDGGIFGKFFDSIGLGWMNNVLSLATNVMTGNWLAAAKDVFNLVSEFSNSSSWMDRVAQQPPLGEFGSGGCFGENCLSQSRLDDFRTASNRDFGLNDFGGLFGLMGDTVSDRMQVDFSLRASRNAARV